MHATIAYEYEYAWRTPSNYFKTKRHHVQHVTKIFQALSLRLSSGHKINSSREEGERAWFEVTVQEYLANTAENKTHTINFTKSIYS